MRYFFDIRGHDIETRDSEGLELDNEMQAQREARRMLAEIAEGETRFLSSSILTARVRDQAGHPVYHAVLTLEGQRLH